MTSLDAIRRRLDTQFVRSEQNINKLALRTIDNGASLDDIHAFNTAMRQNSVASYCVNQEMQVKHNLAKAIINEIR